MGGSLQPPVEVRGRSGGHLYCSMASHVVMFFDTLTSALSCLVSGVLMIATCATCHVTTIDSRAPATCTSASVLVAGSLEAGPASHALTDSSTPYRYRY